MEASRKDGSIFPIHLSVSEAWDGGNPRFVGLVHDLSEEYSAREREKQLLFDLQQMERIESMGELAAGLAHELNQPLTAIGQYLASLRHLLDSESSDTELKMEMLDKTNRQTERAGAIISALRKFVSPDRGERELCCLPSLVEETVGLSVLETERHRIAIEAISQLEIPKVKIDPIQIRQVVHNLLRNAVHALEDVESPKITIRTELQNDRIVVSVEDNGSGIDPQIKDRLFDRFVTGRAKGLGFGLSICRSIITEHGGTMFADNRRNGGARIGFSLPVRTV